MSYLKSSIVFAGIRAESRLRALGSLRGYSNDYEVFIGIGSKADGILRVASDSWRRRSVYGWIF